MVSEPMRAQILSELKQVERRENVRILYAVESGSRAWGFASPDSDYDARFVFIRPMHDYLRLRPLRDVIELPIVNDLDINGWDIVKTLNLFRSSNPPLLEWLNSPVTHPTVKTGGFLLLRGDLQTLRTVLQRSSSPQAFARPKSRCFPVPQGTILIPVASQV